MRLRGVRIELRQSCSRRTRVADVAAQWGFWHMGQFAADYRRRFGELPSETLRRESPTHGNTARRFQSSRVRGHSCPLTLPFFVREVASTERGSVGSELASDARPMQIVAASL